MTRVQLSSDASASRERADRLKSYFEMSVLRGDDFICKFAGPCRQSHAHDFTAGQLHHVGKHFDLTRDGRPLRIVVSGQEYGSTDKHVSLETRYQRVAIRSGLERRFSATPGFEPRNPHMKGTTSLLRLLFGIPLGTKHEDEFVAINGERVHLFDAFALVNFLLCSATNGSKNGQSTRTMRKNCAEHYRAAINILSPTLLICQGTGVFDWVRKYAFEVRIVDEQLGFITELNALVIRFTHPSAHFPYNWGHNERTEYLIDTVAPAIEKALTWGSG